LSQGIDERRWQDHEGKHKGVSERKGGNIEMGLDTTHDAFHGAYSAFNRFRQIVCRAIGGSFPPHFLMNKDGSLVRNMRGHLVKNTDLDDKFFT